MTKIMSFLGVKAGSDLSHRELESIDVEIKSLQSQKVVEIDAAACTVTSIMMISDKIMKT